MEFSDYNEVILGYNVTLCFDNICVLTISGLSLATGQFIDHNVTEFDRNCFLTLAIV